MRIELHCRFTAICLSPEQEQAFCQRLLEDYGRSAMQALSKIDVNAAQGNPKDSALILPVSAPRLAARRA